MKNLNYDHQLLETPEQTGAGFITAADNSLLSSIIGLSTLLPASFTKALPKHWKGKSPDNP